eukprot:6188459-Pleurochrysis_carterae.AAC.3
MAHCQAPLRWKRERAPTHVCCSASASFPKQWVQYSGHIDAARMRSDGLNQRSTLSPSRTGAHRANLSATADCAAFVRTDLRNMTLLERQGILKRMQDDVAIREFIRGHGFNEKI